MNQPASNPATPGDIEALADSLSACADELHARIMKAIRRAPPGGGNQGTPHAEAQALFENEVALRQHAHSLYVDAARLAVSGLGAPQRELLDLVALARRRIRQADLLKDMIGISADILGLAAAIAAGKPEHLPAVVESVKKRYARLKDGMDGKAG